MRSLQALDRAVRSTLLRTHSRQPVRLALQQFTARPGALWSTMALEVPPSAGAMRRGVPLGHAAATRAHCHILFPHLHSPALAYIRPESRERGAVEENVDGRRFFARQVKRGAGMAQHDPRAGLFRRDRRAEKPEPLPPIPLEYFFEAPKRHMVRGMALLALGQLGLVGGFSPYFWMHMPGFSDLWRGLFISGLSGIYAACDSW
ncbi:hypothetical protein T484DRAFT_1772731 [Baffinella frigidus]|nr:hypothetical protein T484DRAFT_1772731 [Cryptophyta sp. CCMP2293]